MLLPHPVSLRSMLIYFSCSYVVVKINMFIKIPKFDSLSEDSMFDPCMDMTV